jgi:hypothetical protein
MLSERSAFSYRIRIEHGSFTIARFVWRLAALIKERETLSFTFDRYQGSSSP